jgi:hypothetical protein
MKPKIPLLWHGEVYTINQSYAMIDGDESNGLVTALLSWSTTVMAI